MTNKNAFSETLKEGVYKAIFERRDMRHFLPKKVDEALLQKLLEVAHAAPSVGFMQPWRIIRVQSPAVRLQLHACVEQERVRTAQALSQKSEEFMALKVQGILDCAEVWVISLMDKREGHIFGRRTLPEMDVASVACAIQNIWLAARAEGLGVGWVSIFSPEQLSEVLGLPEDAEPLAILCIGHVDAFYEEPMLIKEGWAERGVLEDYVMTDQWDEQKAARAQQQWQD